MRKLISGVAVAALLTGFGAAASPVDDVALAEAIDLYEAEAWPESSEDAEPGADETLPDLSPKADRRRADLLSRVKARLDAIAPDRLSPQGRLSLEILGWTVDDKLASLRFDESRMPFDSDGGFDLEPAYRAAKARPRDAGQARRWLRLMRAFPAFYRANLDNARRGIQTGFVQPAPTVAAVLQRARAAAAVPLDEDPLLEPLRALPEAIPQAEREALLAEGRQLIEQAIAPARRAFVTFLEDEYAPHARRGLAASDLPDGRAYYAFLVRRHTTTEMTPDEVHALGQREVARIRAEMLDTMRETGFQGSLADFIAALRRDPRFVAESRQDLLEKAAEIAKRVDDRLPAFFRTLPRLSYGVRPVPASIEDGYTTGRYFPGNPDLGRAGGLMINTSHLDQRPLYELPALVLHEGAPGHHIQVALAQEQAEVPKFRRDQYVTAFGEGWGLYAERLGEEMGIYRDPYERFGRLSYEMWRACRLVADTGIHWQHWSLQQARTCFAENTALSPLNIDLELQRYVSWPGQALAYKTGELKLVELRGKAEAALGRDFELRDFHDAVLLNGALPLTVLTRQIEAWLAARQAQRPSAPG